MARDPSPTPKGGLDPTFDVDAAPRVGGNSSMWPLAFGVVAALGLGTVVFLQLNATRENSDRAKLAASQPPVQAAVATTPAPAPMPVYEPPAPIPMPPSEPSVMNVQPPPPPAPAGPTQAEIDRLRAPALVVDLGEYKAPGAPGAPATAGNGQGLTPGAIAGAVTGAANAGAGTNLNPDERFAQRFGVGDTSKPVKAGHLGDMSTTVIEGSVIPAVLETAINSDLPGYVRAIVTRDVKGFDGKDVLIPRGARLIGQYKSGVALGQSRAFVIWTRLIRPDGATIELASPATDSLGRGGLDGKVDNHFFERFGGAMLLSLLNLGVGAVTDSADTNIVIASTRSGLDAGGSAITSGTNISATVTVPQGSPVRVFVSQDLDFSTVGPVQPATAPNPATAASPAPAPGAPH